MQNLSNPKNNNFYRQANQVNFSSQNILAFPVKIPPPNLCVHCFKREVLQRGTVCGHCAEMIWRRDMESSQRRKLERICWSVMVLIVLLMIITILVLRF